MNESLMVEWLEEVWADREDYDPNPLNSLLTLDAARSHLPISNARAEDRVESCRRSRRTHQNLPAVRSLCENGIERQSTHAVGGVDLEREKGHSCIISCEKENVPDKTRQS